jgi:4-carboxymuconolactone decarboxylase
MLAIYDFAADLNRSNTVDETIYRRVLERWDVIGVVELTALIGYYTMVAMTLNAHEIPLPDGATPRFERQTV